MISCIANFISLKEEGSWLKHISFWSYFSLTSRVTPSKMFPVTNLFSKKEVKHKSQDGYLWGEGEEGRCMGFWVMEVIFLDLVYSCMDICLLIFYYIVHLYCALFLYLCYICINLKVYISCRIVVTFGKGKEMREELWWYRWRFYLEARALKQKEQNGNICFTLVGYIGELF